MIALFCLVLVRSCLSGDRLGRVKDERAHSEIPASRGPLSFYSFFFLLFVRETAHIFELQRARLYTLPRTELTTLLRKKAE